MKHRPNSEKFAGILFACLVFLCAPIPATFAQAPPLPTVLDSNFEVVEFFSYAATSDFGGGGSQIAVAPGGAFGSDVFVADPGTFSSSTDGRIRRLTDLNGDGDAKDAGENSFAVTGMASPISIDFGYGGDLYIMEYPQSSGLRFIHKLTNVATPVLSQHSSTAVFNPNNIKFLPLDAGGELLITNASQTFTGFGGTNDGRLFSTAAAPGSPSVEWSNGANITEGFPAGWWDPNFQSGVFRDNWLIVKNLDFRDASGGSHFHGSFWAVKDVNGDGDANDAGEAYMTIPADVAGFGAVNFGPGGVGYAVGGTGVSRVQDLNDDGDFWDFTLGDYDPGEVEPFLTHTFSFYSVEPGPGGTIYLTAASGTSPNLTIFVYLVRPVSTGFPPVTPTPPAISSLCSPGMPAVLSGSTGAQGVLDPANTIPPDQPDGGLIWPGTAAVAHIFLDTGEVVFLDAGNAVVGTATLPGVSGTYPAFADGRLHFGRVSLPAGKGVTIAVSATGAGSFTPFPGKAPPAVVLSCGDVILETGSALLVGTPINGPPVIGTTPLTWPGAFAGGGAATNLPAGGFGPRSGSGAAGGAIYPPRGGAGGGSGSLVVDCGLGVDCPSGGFGGGALVVSAAQRVRIDGTIYAVGTNAVPGNPGAEGGGGGSVRIAGTLVEGTGAIDTSGGTGSVNGANGPIEIQAFVEDLYTGTATGSPMRGKPVTAPLPTNLPVIDIVYVAVVGAGDFCGFDCSNTGSLFAPDVALPAAAAAQTVEVEARTTGVPLGTNLVFRAVGTDGSVSEATGPVVATTPCTDGEGACVNLTLNPGATYQIVVTPASAFGLVREPQAAPMRGTVPVTSLRDRSGEAAVAARWARALGADPRTLEAQVARMTVTVGQSGE